MKSLEQTARRICTLDLEGNGLSPETVQEMVDRFWPVVANEIRQGVTLVGEWPFTAEEIQRLSQEYQALKRS